MAGIGLTRADYDGEIECDVFTQNWQAVMLFNDMGSQWRHGPGGPTGLDYQSLKTVMEIHGIKASEWPLIFADVRVMEDEALLNMHSD